MTTPLGFGDHDHRGCIAGGMSAAEQMCREKGMRLTPNRRRVLEILLREHRALGAYQILDEMRGDGMPAQPPVAYRALDFLVEHGLAHKVERLNAFIACAHPGEAHAPIFLICRECRAVAEAPASTARQALGAASEATGFVIEASTVEAVGLCPQCTPEAA